MKIADDKGLTQNIFKPKAHIVVLTLVMTFCLIE